ncbi:BC1881 family protein [Bacillus halotolerans]
MSYLHCDSHELKKPTSNKDQSYEKIEVGGIFVDGPAVILINQQYIKIVE